MSVATQRAGVETVSNVSVSIVRNNKGWKGHGVYHPNCAGNCSMPIRDGDAYAAIVTRLPHTTIYAYAHSYCVK